MKSYYEYPYLGLLAIDKTSGLLLNRSKFLNSPKYTVRLPVYYCLLFLPSLFHTFFFSFRLSIYILFFSTCSRLSFLYCPSYCFPFSSFHSSFPPPTSHSIIHFLSYICRSHYFLFIVSFTFFIIGYFSAFSLQK